MSYLQTNIHNQAYFQTLIAALESADAKALHLTRLKRVGLVTGAAVAGTVLGGPIGLIVGAGVATSKAFHMKHYDEAFADMLDALRSMPDKTKCHLVSLTESLVGSSDTDAVLPFIKDKANREKLFNLVSNFLQEETGYQWPTIKLAVRPEHDKPNGGTPYKRLCPPSGELLSPIDSIGDPFCDRVSKAVMDPVGKVTRDSVDNPAGDRFKEPVVNAVVDPVSNLLFDLRQ